MTDTTTDTLTPGVHSPTTTPACGVQRHFGEHNDDGTHVCNDGPGHFVDGSPHACRCGYRWAAAGELAEPTEVDYNAAIEKLARVYGEDTSQLAEMIETVRDDVTLHDVDGPGHLSTCIGCMTEMIADAVTRAVNGKAA